MTCTCGHHGSRHERNWPYRSAPCRELVSDGKGGWETCSCADFAPARRSRPASSRVARRLMNRAYRHRRGRRAVLAAALAAPVTAAVVIISGPVWGAVMALAGLLGTAGAAWQQ